MKKAIIIVCTVLLHLSIYAQPRYITTDSLLHHLQQAENVYACFDYQTGDLVVNHFYDYEGLDFNDSLKYLLVELFNDSIGWAKYVAKGVKQNLEKEPEPNKRRALQGYLKRNFNKAFADSVLNNEKLFNQYFDSLCEYEERSSFEEDMKKSSSWNLPNSLTNIIAHSHYPEVYDKMLYYWKNHKGANCEKYLLNVECPEMIADIESKLDNNDLIYVAIRYMCTYRSESIKMLIKALDNSKLVDNDLKGFDFDIPLNVYLLLRINDNDLHNEWTFKSYVFECSNFNEITYNYESVIAKLKTIKTQKQAIKMSQYIIDNKNLIIPFFEQHYQKCLNNELYWKQNMPYYKKE